MTLMLNWPPSRGPHPFTTRRTYVPGKLTSKDLPQAKEDESAKAERAVVAALEKGVSPLVLTRKRTGKAKRVTRKRIVPKRDPLIGAWSVWYQVTDVLSLSLEQAVRILTAHREKPTKDTFDDWRMAEPRALWVDLTYPLSRGVRLVVQPMQIRTEIFSKGKKKKRAGGHTRRELSVGYFLWTVAKEYDRIYREHKKYGVWGHAIGDLGFEQISIGKDGIVRLFIGS